MKALFLFPALAALTLGCASTTKIGDAPKQYKGFTLEKTYEPYPELKVFEYVHKKSGLHVVLTPRPGTETIAYVTAFDVGSRFEEKGRTGLAHLFEHMMFRGTESFPKPFETIADWGNNFNAYTSRDMTVYFGTVPAELLPEVAKFEGERMRQLLITPQGFQQERGAVVSERKMRTEDSPSGRLSWELYLLAFKEHPYRVGPIGFQKDLDASSFEDALNFYQRYYAPNRAVISIAGGFDPKATLDILSKNYGAYESVDVKEPTKVVEPPFTGIRRKVIRLKTESALISDATHGLSADDKDAAAEVLMCVLLADNDIGYLGNTLVEKGIAQSVGASCSPSKEPGLSMIIIQGSGKISAAKLETEYGAALSGFPKWLSKDRVENLKLYFMGSQLASLREPDELAEAFATSYVLTKNPMMSIDFLKQIQGVTYEDVLRRFVLRAKSGKIRVLIEPSKVSDPISGS
ncbi:MAG TPA: pitrilysin family protein [Bdellovibrionota bacterium]|nr:pitrilysin family protein [Bdellovibrionota bacterium]